VKYFWLPLKKPPEEGRNKCCYKNKEIKIRVYKCKNAAEFGESRLYKMFAQASHFKHLRVSADPDFPSFQAHLFGK